MSDIDIINLEDYKKVLLDVGNSTDTFAILQIVTVLEAMIDEIEDLKEKINGK